LHPASHSSKPFMAPLPTPTTSLLDNNVTISILPLESYFESIIVLVTKVSPSCRSGPPKAHMTCPRTLYIARSQCVALVSMHSKEESAQKVKHRFTEW
jgi:hypothetical protein